MSETRTQILSAGLASVAGESLASAAKAIFENELFIESDPDLIGADGMNQIAAAKYPSAEKPDIRDRLCSLFAASIADCVGGLHADIVASTTYPLYLALPGWLIQLPEIRKELEKMFGDCVAGLVHDVRYFLQRETSGMNALFAAADDVATGRVKGAFVSGVDSRITPFALDLLAMTDGVHHSQNPYGCIPGEAAATIFLAHKRTFPGVSPRAEIEAKRRIREKVRPYTANARIMGGALSECVNHVLSHLSQDSLPELVLSDLNGDRYRAEEFGYTVASLDHPNEAMIQPFAVASNVGDVGAARALQAIAIATEYECRASGKILVTNTSLEGERTAVLLGR